MARDELLHELQLLRAATSADDVLAHFAAIYAALADIERKRSRFLEDAFGAVLRHVWRFVPPVRDASDSDDDDESGDSSSDRAIRSISPLEATERCLAFAAPLLPTVELSQRCAAAAVDTNDDRMRERAVCVAYLLFLLGQDALAVSPQDAVVAALRRELCERIERCGIALETIVSTCRFREELRECSRLLLPSTEPRSDDESDSEDDDDDERKVLVDMTARAWNLQAFAYFVVEAGHEYAFASWSVDGIRALAYELLVASPLHQRSSRKPQAPLALVVAPHAWFFLLAPAIQRFLQIESAGQERLCGVELLIKTLERVPDAAVPYRAVAEGATGSKDRPSFAAACAAFAQRDWLSPLVQLVTNVMVSSPAPVDRSQALAALRLLFAKVAVDDKFCLLQRLLRQCPYANVSAVLVDDVRATAVRVWASLDDVSTSPFATPALGELLYDVLESASERDLVLQADLIASCSSLLRFLAIRDPTNRTGVRSEGPKSVSTVLQRIQRRLQARIRELSPVCGHDDGHASPLASNAQYHAADERNRLLILEAVLASTITC